ncbi:hypothetical protein ACF1HU_23190 [Streptomyces olivaceus]|uniref:hypothetical protein n=1 Tax=Streptomyces olivaceus TaxID=47716 RepID=UPI003702572B
MSAEDLRYTRDLQTSALTAVAHQQEVVRQLEQDVRRERERLAELVCAATSSTPDRPIPYGRIEHVARLLGVKRDRVAKIRAATAARRTRAGRPSQPTTPEAAEPSVLRTAA